MDYFASKEFDSWMQDLIENWHILGISVAIVQDDKIASKAFGYNSPDLSIPCTPDSIFDIASCSKSFTAASVALLVEDEENHPDLQWDTPMSKLLPGDFVMMEDEYTKGVTVEDILSHRSGLPSHDESYLGECSQHQDTAASVTRNLRNLPISSPIRSKYQYCNIMYTVATHLIETRTGIPFSTYLDQNFFIPLGMRSTHLHRSAAKAAGLASRLTLPHVWHEDTQRYQSVNPTEEPEAQGAGAIYTTANDFILYLRAMLQKSSPLSQSVVDAVTTPRILEDTNAADLDPFTSFSTYALGWSITFYRGYRVVSHDGGITGYSCLAVLVPELNFGYCALSNTDNNVWDIRNILMNTFIDRLIGIPEGQCVDWDARAQRSRKSLEARNKEDYEQLIKDLLPGDGVLQPESLILPLDVYTGKYYNAGYHEMEVQIKDGQLFIDANDRNAKFFIILKHIRDQKIFIATSIVHGNDQDQEYFKVEFVLVDNNQENDGGVSKATRMGLHIESELQELIWFDRI